MDEARYQARTASVKDFCGDKAYHFLEHYIDFKIRNNLVTFSANYHDINYRADNQYLNVLALNKLNHIRGINKLFSVINQKLPMNGLLICKFEQRSTRKKRFYTKYPDGINHVFYFIDYLTKRVIPKLLLLDDTYYDITRGKDRILSKTEILGRLVYCGYDIIEVKKINGLSYVIAQKIKKIDEIMEKRQYGALLTLNRVGKNGDLIKVYKFRTMFPYAEYLQAYVLRTYSLQKGGKINRDIRVNTVGKFMRKF